MACSTLPVDEEEAKTVTKTKIMQRRATPMPLKMSNILKTKCF